MVSRETKPVTSGRRGVVIRCESPDQKESVVFYPVTEREMLVFTYAYLLGFVSRLRHMNDGDSGAVKKATEDLSLMTANIGNVLGRIEAALKGGGDAVRDQQADQSVAGGAGGGGAGEGS